MEFQKLLKFINPSLINPSQIETEHKRRTVKSKYDFISIKVKMGQTFQYVFSRFNLSRYLMACQIAPQVATSISQTIKEDLVNSKIFEITQEEVTHRVCELMKGLDSSSSFLHRFQLISKFYLERTPLIIFISGSGFTGKSSLAFQLGERLNISTILQTDIIASLLNGKNENAIMEIFTKNNSNAEEFLHLYNTKCQQVCTGIEGDIIKTLVDGKPLIVEGIHLDPDFFLTFCGKNSLVPLVGFNQTKWKAPIGKRGFILPIFISLPEDQIQNNIRSTVFGFPQKGLDRSNLIPIQSSALALSSYLRTKFPNEYQVNSSGSEGVDQIHSLFLKQLEISQQQI